MKCISCRRLLDRALISSTEKELPTLFSFNWEITEFSVFYYSSLCFWLSSDFGELFCTLIVIQLDWYSLRSILECPLFWLCSSCRPGRCLDSSFSRLFTPCLFHPFFLKHSCLPSDFMELLEHHQQNVEEEVESQHKRATAEPSSSFIVHSSMQDHCLADRTSFSIILLRTILT